MVAKYAELMLGTFQRYDGGQGEGLVRCKLQAIYMGDRLAEYENGTAGCGSWVTARKKTWGKASAGCRTVDPEGSNYHIGSHPRGCHAAWLEDVRGHTPGLFIEFL